MKMGGGIGYDFSTLRPSGDPIRSQDSQTAGPLVFMNVYSEMCLTIASAGHRQGAQMGIMRVDHPDIEKFILAKHDKTKLLGFNLSVAVTDEFMEAVKSDGTFDLTFEGRVYKTIDAANLWETLMRSTYDHAEPGVVFIDRMNEMNNLKYCETIAATNPCAEQPLPPYGACLLGSHNLTKYLKSIGDEGVVDLFNQPNLSSNGIYFDWDQFINDIPPVLRAMDNVIDRTKYPLYEQEKEAKAKRRIGIGVTGLANTGEVLGFSYGSPEFLEFEDTVFRTMANEYYRASALLAAEKGAFPLFSEEYLDSEYLKVLDSDVIDLIREHGIRNSHLISFAPTGTISQIADNVSSGIEPVFSLSQERKINKFEHERIEVLKDYAYRVYGVEGKVSKDVTIKEHTDVLLVAAKWADSAVSKTCNVPENIPWEEFKGVYMKVWEGGGKGCTTFRDGGELAGILADGDKEEEPVMCSLDEFGQKSCA